MPLPQPKASVHSENDCAICHKPLILPNYDDDPSEPSFVIDDAELRCGHHFHQSCIIEYAAASEEARRRCALCRANVLSANGDFIVFVRTENGFEGGIDLGQDIDEAAYYKANPEAERAETFLSLMAQMDFDDAEKFLKGEDGPGVSKLSPDVTYPTGGQTAMHMAALNNDVKGVQLLLRYGADKEARDDDGQTALDMAKDVGAKELFTLLS